MQADNAARKAAEVVQLLKMTGRVFVLAGTNLGMATDSTPVKSAGVDFIIRRCAPIRSCRCTCCEAPVSPKLPWPRSPPHALLAG
jgi:hypothetical protein